MSAATLLTTMASIVNETLNQNSTDTSSEENLKINVPGLVGVVIFYVLILVVGLYASWRNKGKEPDSTDEVMLANRDIGYLVGIFTMTATWVGGGYINGTAEQMYKHGLSMVQAPLGYSTSLFVGGILFAKKMREAGYVTMLDPFARKYGEVIAGILFLPCLLGELFWSASILRALGASLAVILGMKMWVSIIVSAAIAVFYTVVGGLFSVAFTDVIQLICIFVGLWLGVIFGLINPHVTSLSETAFTNPSWWPTCPAGEHCDYTSNATWLGDTPEYPGHYADALILMIFGGIPWQVYFQRVLSARTPAAAQLLSFAAAFGCLIMAIPAILIGAIARSADWTHPDLAFPLSKLDNETHTYIPMKDSSMILPLVLQYLTPTPVAVIGLGAVSAAVMSSADSSILSISSMFANNIYQPIRNAVMPFFSTGVTKGASGSEIVWVMRSMMVLSGAAAMYVAISVESIYKLFYLCSDLVFVVVFPQLLCVVYMKRVNTYGSVASIIMGVIFRLTGGEPYLNFAAAIEYPGFVREVDPKKVGKQNFPYKTLAMVIALVTLVLVSLLFDWLFKRGIIPRRFDVFKSFEDEEDVVVASERAAAGRNKPKDRQALMMDVTQSLPLVENGSDATPVTVQNGASPDSNGHGHTATDTLTEKL